MRIGVSDRSAQGRSFELLCIKMRNSDKIVALGRDPCRYHIFAFPTQPAAADIYELAVQTNAQNSSQRIVRLDFNCAWRNLFLAPKNIRVQNDVFIPLQEFANINAEMQLFER